jgi:DnaJ-domain-containing protein 1
MTELARGELVRTLYRLGRGGATGMLTIAVPGQRSEVLVLRRGHLITNDADVAGRLASSRLARIAAAATASVTFEGGTAAYPPGALRQLSLVAWVRHHLESQLDAGRAVQLVEELAGARLQIRIELAPEAVDEADRRMIEAMTAPHRLDQIASLARTPRFRLLCFIHFLRGVGALAINGVAAEPRRPAPPAEPLRADPLLDARRLLGVEPTADVTAIKRAYRRLARALHPDLRPTLDEVRRRELEQRLAEVTVAYELLV